MTAEPSVDDYDSHYYFDNETEHSAPEELPHAQWILPTLYSVFFVIGLMGNVVVIVVMSRHTSRRADIFILNLAVSDLAFVLTLPFWACSLAQGYWIFGTFLCKASGFAIAVTRCASSFLMAIMSVDRYVAVIRGTKVHPLQKRTCSIRACCVIWAVSVLFGCPSLWYRQLSGETMACVDSEEKSFLRFRIAVVFLTFVFPLTVVVFCYCRMAKYLWNYFGRQVTKLSSKGRPRSRHSWLRIVTFVVGAYCLSWLPFSTLNILYLIGKLGTNIPFSILRIKQGLSAANALAFANSCTNPLIYAFLDGGFRRRAQLAMPRLFLKCRSLLSTASSTMPTTSASVESTSTYTGNNQTSPRKIQIML